MKRYIITDSTGCIISRYRCSGESGKVGDPVFYTKRDGERAVESLRRDVERAEDVQLRDAADGAWS